MLLTSSQHLQISVNTQRTSIFPSKFHSYDTSQGPPIFVTGSWNPKSLAISSLLCPQHIVKRLVCALSCSSSAFNIYMAEFSMTRFFTIAGFMLAVVCSCRMVACCSCENRSAAACSLVSSPDPTYERGSGDIRLIPRASLLSGEKFLSANHIAEKTICSATLEILGYFSMMTQHFFGA